MACLDLLEQIHDAGYIYNDLKLDNLLVDYKQHLPSKSAAKKDCFANASINLVDFGFATKYVEKKRSSRKDTSAEDSAPVHMSKTEVDVFRGNMIFSSTNQLQFYSTSRRDDLIALCYLLIYLVRQGELPKLDIYAKVDRNESFKTIRDTKLAYKMKDLCNEAEGTDELKEFVREIFNYRFKDEPNYDKLRNLLQTLFDKHNPTAKKTVKPTEDAEIMDMQVKASE